MWTVYFHDRIKAALVSENCVLSDSSCTVPFGSKFVDLERCLGCEKYVSVHHYSEGWCYFKGKYKIHRAFFKCISTSHAGLELAEPLTAQEQRSLQECLLLLVNGNNHIHPAQVQTDNELPYPSITASGLSVASAKI
jgi:hypothetical protein